MRRRYSHSEYLNRPKKPFGMIVMDEQERITLSEPSSLNQDILYYREFGYWKDDYVQYDSGLGVITVELRGKPIFLIYLRRRRVESATFSYFLSPDEFREAVQVVDSIGLSRLIRRGIQWFLQNAPRSALTQLEGVASDYLKNHGG